jgi:transcriptional regulator with XRE-family HTH domain
MPVAIERGSISEQISAIRTAATRHVAETSLRHVAREIGMSPSGLSNFLQRVNTPYGKTRAKLLAWFSRSGWLHLDSSEAAAHAALSLLVNGLPAHGREDAQRGIVELIRRAHADHHSVAPNWLPRLSPDPPSTTFMEEP